MNFGRKLQIHLAYLQTQQSKKKEIVVLHKDFCNQGCCCCIAGYRCSGGIAHNKILAKLVCGMNKPNKQTVLPKHCIDLLYRYVYETCT